MKLSFVVVCHNMQRELRRTLRSLQRDYQRNVDDIDYEVVVVDNGSDAPLAASVIEGYGEAFRYLPLENPPPSPAYALNQGVEFATGTVVCLMVDGATLLSPGVVEKAYRCFRAYDRPVVALKYFFLGPGEQNETIARGYTKAAEDRLLQDIDWPEDGYRLFEISTPIKFPGQQRSNWTDKIIESNCLCMRRETFIDLGGCDEQFDLPGGGFMNIDLFQRAAEAPGSTLILLMGEGVFHQLHGGTTTNVPPERRDAEVEGYRRQYRALRGKNLSPTGAAFHYFGHIPNEAAKIHRREYS